MAASVNWSQDNREHILPLVDYLAQVVPSGMVQWRDWRIESVSGGANNRLYHATSGEADLAIKFTIRDARDRAGREHRALATLAEAGLSIAPRPFFLETSRYPLPVIAQEWVAGDVLDGPPSDDAGWQALIAHYATIHTLTPRVVSREFPSAVLTMDSADAGRRRIDDQMRAIPPSAQPARLRALVDGVAAATLPAWQAPPLALCRCDPTPLNFLRTEAGLVSVDWENSGWGDPAFEIADLLAHPAYIALDPVRQDDVIVGYASAHDDPRFADRARAYYHLMLVWWAARFARMLYEVARGQDQRLVPRSADWYAQSNAKLQRYLTLAETDWRSGGPSWRGRSKWTIISPSSHD
jgi:thiamine kinase-like enzyme